MKTKLLLLSIIFSQFVMAQQFEIGPNLGYGMTNIADSRSYEGRAVIGKQYWRESVGFSLIYFFSDPHKKPSDGIHFEFSKSQRGSKSDEHADSKYLFDSKSFNLNYRRAGSLGNKFGIYVEVGFGYNQLDNQNIYRGQANELLAFERIKSPLTIKNNEVTFLYGMGADKLLFKDKCVLSIGFNGDAGISKINHNSGAYRTQSFGLLAGMRYIVPIRKNNI